MNDSKSTTNKKGVNRRTAMKLVGGAVAAAAGVYALSPLKGFTDDLSIEEFLQTHYREMSKEELAKVCERLETKTLEQFGVEVNIATPEPLSEKKFAYGLNLSVCKGCRQCAKACHKENNHDRKSFNSYIRVFEMDKGSSNLANANSLYSGEIPKDNKHYMPVQCHHCDKPPCVDVCPVKATWKEPDGPVVIDYNWCIGCRYCEAACPYHARRFNWTKPEISGEEINPNQSYLSNRVRMQGVMEKCTFCLHRTRVGRLPACLEACPCGARVFGDLADSGSEIRWVLANRRVFVLKEDYGTFPSFFYFFT